jgi:nucleotide-binding universal stress UspA family protein
MPYQNILIPLKGTEPLNLILPHIEKIARSELAEKLTFLRIAGVAVPFQIVTAGPNYNLVTYRNEKYHEEAINQNINEAANFLSAIARLDRFKQSVVTWEVLPPTPVVEAIVDYVRKNQIDLVVMTTRARTRITRWLFGNKAEDIVREVDTPVMLIHIPESWP